MSRTGESPAETGGIGDDHWLVRPVTVRRIRFVGTAVLLLTLIPDLFIEQHADFGVEDGFGFFAWYGFGSCVALVLIARALGTLLKRSERYYDD